MKQFLRNVSLGVIAAAMIAMPVFTASSETVSPVSTILPPVFEIDIKAKFVQAGFVTIEHESFKFSNIIPLIGQGQKVTRQAIVSVKGLSGETVVMTCSVESRTGQNYADGHTNHVRDCSGGQESRPQAIMSGHKADSEILLTNDLLPNASGNIASSIAIEVTYI